MALVVVAVVAYLAVDRAGRAAESGARAPADAVERAGEAAEAIAERFRTGTITTTFTAALPRLVPDGGTTLELATVEATETLRRTDERRVLFDLVSLGTSVSEIRVPTVYRYHVRLQESWRIEVRDGECLVHAPAIRPTLPPAIRTDRMERLSETGWLRFDAAEQMDELERSITPSVSERAAAPETIALVKDQARRRLAEFVRDWLLAEDQWRSDRFTSVTVVFADEEPPPTLELEEPSGPPRALPPLGAEGREGS